MDNLDGNGPVATFLLICLGLAWVIAAAGIVTLLLRNRKARQIAQGLSWSWTIPDGPHASRVPMAPGRWTINPAEGGITWRANVEFQEATPEEAEPVGEDDGEE